ncbi:Target of rapamycin complex 1 subunit kog1 [Coemansia sp. RSA 1365]|nr:Target of rapamycin complex 1 subunit kog1 [Coemansia sp. RSA 1365]
MADVVVVREGNLDRETNDGIAEVTLDPSRGSEDHPALITTTATGTNIDMSELLGGAIGGRSQQQRNRASQTVMEGRVDFHTHPRSLALAHLQLGDWRTHERLRTTGALLVLCLNLGTSPPDLEQPEVSAVLEAWVDPTAPVQAPLADEMVGPTTQVDQRGGKERTPMKMICENLARQYEQINRHTKYKPLPDCAMEDLRKYCVQFRRSVKEERLLFHYNGHGVPRPTASGDIWVFNKQFTQYIPLNAVTLMSWIGTPCVYVWDCSHAMSIVQAFEKNAKLRDLEIARIRHAAEAAGVKLPLSKSNPETLSMVSTNIAAILAAQVASGAAPNAQTGQSQQQSSQSQQNQQQQQQGQGQQHGAAAISPGLINLALLPSMYHEDIHFAATRAGELLPTNPELPADLFTSCLTTPVKAAIRFWVIRNPHTSKITLDQCEKLPGQVHERRTPVGELNWIFTSITDTIAWNTLPRDLFRKLFRQDVLVASLYRNFMLADRIMRFYGVHPQSSPAIPPTHKHPLWDSLDLEIDMCLAQLPRLLKEDTQRQKRDEQAKRGEQGLQARANLRGRQRPSTSQGTNGTWKNNGQLPLSVIEKPPLEIVDSFKQTRSRNRSRIGLGGKLETDEDDAGSGYDSDGVDLGGDMAGVDGQQTGYISSTYFSNQLFAFEVWLQHAATTVSQFVMEQNPDQIPRSLSTEPPPNIEPPDELPAVLQVLLSQQYRMRALILLYRFMNLGPWAVDLAMAVGIYPYMSKLLASATTEIGEILILVWTRLVAIDRGVHPDLMKPEGLKHFVDYLSNNIQMQYEPVSEKVLLCDTVSAASAFTLTMLCRGVSAAQQACFNERVLDYFLVYLQRPDNGTEERARLRTWVLMCLAELWRGYPNAKWMALTYRLCVIASKKQLHAQETQEQPPSPIAEDVPEDEAQGSRRSFEELLASSVDDDSVDEQNAQNLLIPMAFHRSPVVRTAAIYAMGTLLEDMTQLGFDPGVVALLRKAERQIYALLLQAATDGSPMVRREVARVIGSAVFATYMPQTMKAVARAVGEEIREPRRPLRTYGADAEEDSESILPEVPLDLLLKLYKTLLELSADVHPDVSLLAREACDVLMQTYAHSRAFFDAEPSLDQALHRLEITRSSSGQQPILGFIRSAGTGIGDVLLGFPPSSHGGSPVSQGGGMQNQSLQHRRVALPRSRNPAGLQQQPRSRDAVAQNSSVPAHHRYTMHFSQGGMSRQGLFSERQTPPTPRSPSATGSISTANLDSLDERSVAVSHPSSQQPQQQSLSPRVRDRFDGMSDEERAEARQKLVEIEKAWQEWCRNELRENICESTLLDWAGAYFTEFDISLFANVNGPLQGSLALVESRERNRRVEKMENSARTMGTQAGSMKWMDVCAVANNRDPASVALLHPLEPHAIVASSKGTVSVYDWELAAQVGHYSIGSQGNHSEASLISSLHLINPLGHSKLLVGTRDGKVRIFSSHVPDFDPSESSDQKPVFPQPRLVTGFTALPWASLGAGTVSSAHPLQGTTLAQNTRLKAQRIQQQQPILLHQQSSAPPPLSTSDTSFIFAGARIPGEPEGCGLVTAWNQRSSVLFAGGNDKEVRVWDVAAEMCIEEIPVVSMGGITCVSHDGVSGNIFAVGNANGLVRVMDRRLDARSGAVASWREHSPDAIRNVTMRPGQAEVISAGSNGNIKYWDLRHRESVFTLVDTHINLSLEHMIAHENAPVILTSSDATVKLWNQRGNNIGLISASAKHSNGATAAAYVKSLTGYGGANKPQNMVRIVATAMHTYLPVALMVTDDGRVSYIQPTLRASSIAASRASSIM